MESLTYRLSPVSPRILTKEIGPQGENMEINSSSVAYMEWKDDNS